MSALDFSRRRIVVTIIAYPLTPATQARARRIARRVSRIGRGCRTHLAFIDLFAADPAHNRATVRYHFDVWRDK